MADETNSVLAIDPGTYQSAFVVFDGKSVVSKGIVENATLEMLVETTQCQHVACEMIASYGMPVGAETFETVFWIGRLAKASRVPFHRVFRKDVKIHLCNSMRAKDANIRQASIDKFGGESAVGKKSHPGPLYGVSSHCWSALAVAVYFTDKSLAILDDLRSIK